jgi:hypothetical protein
MRRLLAVTLGCALAASPAAAQPTGEPPAVERAAIVGLELGGDAAPQLRRTLSRSIADGLAGAGVQVVGSDEVASQLASRSELTGCSSTACVAEIGERLGVGHLVRGQIEARGADYTIVLELVAVADGGVIRRVEDTCTVCTVGDLSRRAAAVAGRLIGPAAAVEVEVELASSPEGALLRVDGAELGRAPQRARLTVGQHTVRAELDGRAVSEKVIQVEAGGQGPQRFELVLAPRQDDGEAPRRYRTWKWVAASGAVALVGTGVALVAIDGGGTCDASGQCDRLYDTAAAGWVSIAVGAGVGGAAGWMFWRDRNDERRATVAVTPRGASLHVSF